MFVVGLLGWWYTDGWKQRFTAARRHIERIYDYFSIDTLIMSLFSPFRQISAGQVGGSLSVKWQAFVDRTVSRCIGAVMRLLLVIVGCLALVGISLVGMISIVCWLCIPILPLAGIVMMAIGWTPTWI